MIRKLLFLLLLPITHLSLCGLYPSISVNSSVTDLSVPLGHDDLLFDSDGDGVKDDVAELTCLGMSGGYGTCRLEVFVSEKSDYRKVFDSDQYILDESTYNKLSENLDKKIMLDTFYSVEAIDIDGDGCEELICRQYAWVECHAEHIGNVVSVIKVSDCNVRFLNVRLETPK